MQRRWMMMAAMGVFSVFSNSAKSATDTTAFAADLYSQLGAQKGNLFFSPMSIESALAMTFAGAGGRTADQMAKTLHFDGGVEKISSSFATVLKALNHPGEISYMVDENGKPLKGTVYELAIANALWTQNGYAFEPAYKELVQKNFAAGLNTVDYRQTEAARVTINDWVAKQTRDRIKDLIGRGTLNADTRLVLTNAIYFKSNWQSKFSKSATKDGPFHLSAGESKTVPLMQRQQNAMYLENADLQMLELPYLQDELSMIVLLPRSVEGLPDLEKKLSAANLRGWFDGAKSERVAVTLPKFKFSAEFELGATLKAMGMTDAFDPNKANFSGMNRSEKLFLSAVIHKAFVAVDEEGTEAAAATAVAVAGAAAVHKPEEPKVFRADHPFLFFIQHRTTGEILFVGRVSDPLAS